MPQGSILGSFLFLVYIDDLPRNIENIIKVEIFADDTSVAEAGPRNQCNLQTVLDRINNWFSYNKLSINIPKREVMNFGFGTRKDMTLSIEKLLKRNACKNLGVYLDKKLLFHDHIEYVVKNRINSVDWFIKSVTFTP